MTSFALLASPKYAKLNNLGWKMFALREKFHKLNFSVALKMSRKSNSSAFHIFTVSTSVTRSSTWKQEVKRRNFHFQLDVKWKTFLNGVIQPLLSISLSLLCFMCSDRKSQSKHKELGNYVNVENSLLWNFFHAADNNEIPSESQINFHLDWKFTGNSWKEKREFKDFPPRGEFRSRLIHSSLLAPSGPLV